MKRLFALLVAAMMLLGVTPMAFAADWNYPVADISSEGFILDDDGDLDLASPVSRLPFGETIYFPLINDGTGPLAGYSYVHEADAVKSARVKAKWEQGEAYVKDVEIVRQRVTDSSVPADATTAMKNIYCLAVSFGRSSLTSTRDVLGNITISKSGSDGFELDFDFAYEVGNDSASSGGVVSHVITEDTTTFNFRRSEDFDTDSNGRVILELAELDGGTLEVNTNGESSVAIAFDCNYIDAVGDQFMNADLCFFNGNYASFAHSATVTLPCPEGHDYLYSINRRNELERVNVRYDSNDESYEFSTRVFGRYVASDVPLEDYAASSSTPASSTPASSGSGTGTGTGTGSGTAASSGAPASSSTAPVPSSSTSVTPSSEAPSSSEPESSEPESSEPESVEPSSSEPESSEPQDDLVTVDNEIEAPEEETQAVPTYLWVLLAAVVIAVPVGLGMAYYLKNRSAKATGDDWDEESDEKSEDDDSQK